MKKFLTITALLFVLAIVSAVAIFWYVSAHTVTVKAPKTINNSLEIKS